jgi:putative peptidoglycan binding protein
MKRTTAILFVALILGVAPWSPAQAAPTSQILQQQEMLIWTTDYEGTVDGIIGPETIKAIRQFQTRLGNPPTGQLTQAEESDLNQQGAAAKRRAGFRQIVDDVAGVSVGIPLNFVATPPRSTKWGKHWEGQHDGLAIDTLRFSGDVSLRQLYDRLTTINNRTVAYQRFVDNEWFVIAAFEDSAAVYVKVEVVPLADQPSEMRGFSIWMSRDRPIEYQAIPPAMLSTFTTIKPNVRISTPAPQPNVPAAAPPTPPPPRETPAQANVPVVTLSPNPAPIQTTGTAGSITDCYNGLGPRCPRILTAK